MTKDNQSLNLKVYQASFFRRLLGVEKLQPEQAKVRNHFLKETLIPVLEKIDVEVAGIRDKYCLRNEDGSIKIDEEKGTIDYGENAEVSRKAFDDLMDKEINIPVDNADIMREIQSIFIQSKYAMDENETVVYSEIFDAFNELKI